MRIPLSYIDLGFWLPAEFGKVVPELPIDPKSDNRFTANGNLS